MATSELKRLETLINRLKKDPIGGTHRDALAVGMPPLSVDFTEDVEGGCREARMGARVEHITESITLVGEGTMCLKRALSFFVLMLCYTLTNGESIEGYSSEIKCVIDKYGASFSKSTWTKQTTFSKEHFLLNKLVRDRFVDRNHVISYEYSGLIMGDSKSHRDCFGVEIWKMKSSVDAKSLSETLTNAAHVGVYTYLYKMPKAFYAFDDYFILFDACSFATQFDVEEERDKMVKVCFESD